MKTAITKAQDKPIQAQDSPVTRRGPFVTPAVDVYHGESGWLVRADLPGVAIEDVNLDVDQGRITIEAYRGDGNVVRLTLHRR